MLYHYRPPFMSQKKIIFLYCSILILLSNFNFDESMSPKSSFKNVKFPVSSSSLNFWTKYNFSKFYTTPTKSNKISVVISGEKCFNAFFSKFNNCTPFINCFDTKGKKNLCLLLLQLRGFNHFRRLLTFHFVKRLSP